MSRYDERAGRCYELALLGFLSEQSDLPGVRLVHGYPRLQKGPNKGKKYGHAWLEFGQGLGLKMVWDAVTESAIPAFLYYTAGEIDPEECQHYTPERVADCVLEHQTYGPWEHIPEDAIFGDG